MVLTRRNAPWFRLHTVEINNWALRVQSGVLSAKKKFEGMKQDDFSYFALNTIKIRASFYMQRYVLTYHERGAAKQERTAGQLPLEIIAGRLLHFEGNNRFERTARHFCLFGGAPCCEWIRRRLIDDRRRPYFLCPSFFLYQNTFSRHCIHGCREIEVPIFSTRVIFNEMK